MLVLVERSHIAPTSSTCWCTGVKPLSYISPLTSSRWVSSRGSTCYLLSLSCFNDFLHFSISWMIDFFYFLIHSFITAKCPKKFCSHLLPRKTIKCLLSASLWSLFQAVKKCPNDYWFFKNMSPLQTLANKTPACK